MDTQYGLTENDMYARAEVHINELERDIMRLRNDELEKYYWEAIKEIVQTKINMFG